MTIWIDAQLSPFIALWINNNFPQLQAKSLRSLGLRDASDLDIFQRARVADITLISKDADFVKLIDLLGTPPKTDLDNLRKHIKFKPLRHTKILVGTES